MPLQERLGQKTILTDARRLATIMGIAKGGGSSPHPLLSARHTDTDPNAPATGALVLGDATPEWGILLCPAAAGYAFISTATTVEWDQTPDWTGLHTYYDGLRGEFRASHFSMGESHGIGGTTYITTCAGLRSILAV